MTDSVLPTTSWIQNFELAVKPLLKPGMKVLEFACGTGSYSKRLLPWGAGNLTGVDISPVMVLSDWARFLVGDGSKPVSLAPNGSKAYFDLAFGAWFLNYGQSKEHLSHMFANISLNLKPGGVFVGVVPPPSESLDRLAELCTQPPLNRMWPKRMYTEKLASGDGWRTHVFLDNKGVDFKAWHLRKQVFEEAARLGGMLGKLKWRTEVLGPEHKANLAMSDEEWEVRQKFPEIGIIIVRKE
ncbi:hypothetical protein PT974_12536 [Cladobotryum mycophilum]|uniref:Methyltransferase domain-containing protein n=1 Tax=Cladobotryum mycophilum TaxID=491253 RepID=A0ABR0S8S1_9HYPO